ncbi:MAG TPA: NAD(P)-binding protein [Oligoflexus sp.]|uniref:NAD(P)-binding protein n=1 Tax=Oligoflexus sp. TaxID=1971216 RepID=UPI002D26B339|nr:NAD(P)-binding protein [Oligoflexus sp.]HYX35144.1 NAD(P)-binding protein [Oligoflexus sp.]
MSINRRDLLIGGMALPMMMGCGERKRELRLTGDDSAHGHRLRTMDFPAASDSERCKVLILGGGVAGCTAAYTLKKQGFGDYRLLEMGGEAGGNARSGKNSVSDYPLGAHYLPLPNAEEKDLLEFLQDAGALQGWTARGEPRYRDEFLCHDPEDRVFYEGRWFEGLIAWKALAPHEVDDIRAFFRFISSVRQKKGQDGRRLFAIPLDRSSRDSEWLKLDLMTFAEFVRGQGWHSPYLAWYLDYCCRDDYGAGWQDVSAWAGLHYFAARDAERGEGATILTWPEGNAWLIRQLMKRSQDRMIGDTLIFRIERSGQGFVVEGWQSHKDRTVRWEAESLIVALPRFVAQRLLPGYAAPVGAMSYAPWMVANCTVDALPQSPGSALAWDNVPFGSASLGYVVATHQKVQRYEGASVLSSYWPLAAQKPEVARMMAGLRQCHDWERMVLADLESMHPGISASIGSMDFWLWGHGMIQPRPGFIWGKARARLQERSSNLAFAHSDMSGISIFEEAFARGREAALHILQGRRFG